ncbi:hypothetical protein D3C83_79900 [compost metagenome]
MCFVFSSTSTAGTRLPSTVRINRCEITARSEIARSASSDSRASRGKKLMMRFNAL